MNSKPKIKNRIRLKKKQSLYTLSENLTEYYPRAGGSWVMLPFWIVGAGFFLLITGAVSSMFAELTWEMFFSLGMVGMTLIWLMMALITVFFLCGTYANIAQVSLTNEPVLVLTPEGLCHRHSLRSKQAFVAWSNIDAIWIQPRYPNAQPRYRQLKMRISIKATASEPASVAWVDFRDAKCEEYTLYQNVLKYWRQYRGDHWQGNPNILETVWRD